MDIISYRGPGKAGGVSPAIQLLMDAQDAGHHWWFMDDNCFKRTVGTPQVHAIVGTLPKEVVEGHYRYCNEFLWPIMHDLPEFATHNPDDEVLYDRFNRLIARNMLSGAIGSSYFVQDYQLALMPQLLKRKVNRKIGVFWHIPWPKYVPDQFVKPLAHVVRALLAADVIGFHRKEYAHNFLHFVEYQVSDVFCSHAKLSIARDPARSDLAIGTYVSPYFDRGSPVALVEECPQTQVLVAPLGLDFDFWNALSADHNTTMHHRQLLRAPYVLSVDRADYTKGVTHRLDAIDLFFTTHRDMIGKLTFAQVCGRTRPGLSAFDNYWNECRTRVADLNGKFGNSDWKPIYEMDNLNSAELSILYRNAKVMLVNPVRDGLNLTAKEFVVCQQAEPGVLALSSHAGAWDELGEHCVEVEPRTPAQMSYAIYCALHMDRTERAQRIESLKRCIKENELKPWGLKFQGMLDTAPAAAQVLLREIS